MFVMINRTISFHHRIFSVSESILIHHNSHCFVCLTLLSILYTYIRYIIPIDEYVVWWQTRDYFPIVFRKGGHFYCFIWPVDITPLIFLLFSFPFQYFFVVDVHVCFAIIVIIMIIFVVDHDICHSMPFNCYLGCRLDFHSFLISVPNIS